MLGFSSCSKDDPEVIINKITKDTLIQSEIQTNQTSIDVLTTLPENGKVYYLRLGESIQLANFDPEGKLSICFSVYDPKVLSIDQSGKVTLNEFDFENVIYATYQNDIIAQYSIVPLGAICFKAEAAEEEDKTCYNQYCLTKESNNANTLYLFNSNKPTNDVQAIKKLDRIEINFKFGDRNYSSTISLFKNGKEQKFSNPNVMPTLDDFKGTKLFSANGFLDDQRYLIYFVGDFEVSNLDEFKPEGSVVLKDEDGNIDKQVNSPYIFGQIWENSGRNYGIEIFPDEESARNFKESNLISYIEIVEQNNDGQITYSASNNSKFPFNASASITKEGDVYTIDYSGEDDNGNSIEFHYKGTAPYLLNY